MSSLVEIYDSEVKVIQEVLATLNDRTYKPHDLEAFDREITERFGERGFKVNVLWYETDQRGVYMPEVEVVERIKPIKAGEFDHERMAHEVVNNVLGLPSEDAGIIKTPGKWTSGKDDHGH